MKTLTVRQPWAWAIIHGGKDIENRTWATRHRGPLAIHAGANPRVTEAAEWIAEHRPGVTLPEKYQYGAVIGTVILIDVVEGHPSGWAMPDHLHWVLADPIPVRPMPAKGQLSLWDFEVRRRRR